MLHLHSKQPEGQMMGRSRKPTRLHFKIKESVADVLDLSFCPWKSTEEVCSFFLSLCFGRLWFSNEVDDLKEAQYSEEVRQVVELVLLRGFEICHCITQAIREEGKTAHPGIHDLQSTVSRSLCQ